jgi:2-oxoisovalerate dehydrogenase E1 component
MVYRCLEAAKGFEGQVEIIDLRTVIPWDKEGVLNSVRETGKCLIVHEDSLTVGFGAEIAATIAQDCFTFLDAPVKRRAVPDIPIPYNIPLMGTVLPSMERIRIDIEELLRW